MILPNDQAELNALLFDQDLAVMDATVQQQIQIERDLAAHKVNEAVLKHWLKKAVANAAVPMAFPNGRWP